MGKRITYAIVQLWHQITGPVVVLWQRLAGAVRAWMEWQDAKCWAAEYHPGWLHVVKKCKHKSTQAHYKDKILKAYRGEE